MEQATRFLARPGFIAREVAGESVLIPLDTDNVYLNREQKLPIFNGMIQLNGLGLFLWQQIEQPKTMEELVAAVGENYDADGRNIREDIENFLEIGLRNQVIFLVS